MRGRQTKKGRRDNARDLGVVEWKTPVGRAERAGPGGKEGDAGADANIDEREEEENDGEREKHRRAEERTREEGGKEEGRGNAREGGEKVSRKGNGGGRRR